MIIEIDDNHYQELKELLLSQIARFTKECDQKHKRAARQPDAKSKRYYTNQAGICVANSMVLSKFLEVAPLPHRKRPSPESVLVDIEGVTFAVEYDYQPEERQTRYEPGCSEELTINNVYVVTDGFISDNIGPALNDSMIDIIHEKLMVWRS